MNFSNAIISLILLHPSPVVNYIFVIPLDVIVSPPHQIGSEAFVLLAKENIMEDANHAQFYSSKTLSMYSLETCFPQITQKVNILINEMEL